MYPHRVYCAGLKASGLAKHSRAQPSWFSGPSVKAFSSACSAGRTALTNCTGGHRPWCNLAPELRHPPSRMQECWAPFRTGVRWSSYLRAIEHQSEVGPHPGRVQESTQGPKNAGPLAAMQPRGLFIPVVSNDCPGSILGLWRPFKAPAGEKWGEPCVCRGLRP
jgi:hypothetical protein